MACDNLNFRLRPVEGVCVIRLSSGKLLVNLLHVFGRTNTPTNNLTNGVVDRPCFFWVVGSNPTSHHNKLFQAISHIDLEKYSPRVYTQELQPLRY